MYLAAAAAAVMLENPLQ